jgi:hypothetical protein
MADKKPSRVTRKMVNDACVPVAVTKVCIRVMVTSSSVAAMPFTGCHPV